MSRVSAGIEARDAEAANYVVGVCRQQTEGVEEVAIAKPRFVNDVGRKRLCVGAHVLVVLG